jgi:hypothetical protein
MSMADMEPGKLDDASAEPVEAVDAPNEDIATPVIDFQSFLREKDELLQLVKSLGDLSHPLTDEELKAVEARVIAIVRLWSRLAALLKFAHGFSFVCPPKQLEPDLVFRIIQLDKYQEQPQLLDPHLETLISGLMRACRVYVSEKRSIDSRGAKLFRIVYWFTKVRGSKTICMYSTRTWPLCPPEPSSNEFCPRNSQLVSSHMRWMIWNEHLHSWRDLIKMLQQHGKLASLSCYG